MGDTQKIMRIEKYDSNGNPYGYYGENEVFPIEFTKDGNCLLFFSGRTFIIAPFDTIDGIDDTKSVLFSLTDNQLKSMNWMRPQEMGSFSCDGKYVGIVIGKEV